MVGDVVYDRVGEAFDSVSRLSSPRSTDTKVTRWRRGGTVRQQTAASPATSAPTSRVSLSATSKVSLTGGRADSQDQLVSQIVGSQEMLAPVSPTTSVTEVDSKVGELVLRCR